MEYSAIIPKFFLKKAISILGDTDNGLTGSEIAENCTAYAYDYNVDIPYPDYPFPKDLPNKRTALLRNLEVFEPYQQYTIILNLCNFHRIQDNSNVKQLKATTYTRFSHLFPEVEMENINVELIEETRHWLEPYSEAYKMFTEGVSKYKSGVLIRNLLDDFRLSLGLLCKELLGNDKSLENQLPIIGAYIKEKGGSAEVRNLFYKVIEYYGKYQNSFVKHSDAVIETEVDFVVEITCSMMKYLIKVNSADE